VIEPPVVDSGGTQGDTHLLDHRTIADEVVEG
jgi:hypothetical protein